MQRRIRTVVLSTFVLATSAISAFAEDAAPAGASHMGHDGYHRRFDDAEHWAKIFNDPARDEWQKPDKVIGAFKLHDDDKVADIGAGTGYFSIPFAKAVSKGKVYAVDTESTLLAYTEKLAKKDGLTNVVAVKCDANDAKLPEKVNLAIVVDTYHHIDDRPNYFKKLKQSLAPGGRLAIIDFTAQSKMGPPPQHRIPAKDVELELKEAGFKLAKKFDFLPNQYFLVFE
jgi:ubiquinone/menaquinone biosynthesis C-methylase UbiE